MEQQDLNDIVTLLSSTKKVNEQSLKKFIDKKIISSIDSSPFLTTKIHVLVKVGKILK